MELSIKFCDKLIVNSNFAKKEIIDFLKIEEKKIQVVYLGADNQNEIYFIDFHMPL